MKVLVLTGSPHTHGATALLTQEFIRGAEEAGHEVTRIDTATLQIHPCIACEQCHHTDKGCVFKEDDMQKVTPYLLHADAVIFITPVYYYAVTAQLKAVIDRFYANDELLHCDKKAALLLAYADTEDKTADGPATSFANMTEFLEWENLGVIAAKGCADRDDIEITDYPQKAYELGKSL